MSFSKKAILALSLFSIAHADFNATVTGYVNVGVYPWEIAFTEVGGVTYGYVTNYQEDSVSVLTLGAGTATNVWTQTLAPRAAPQGIAFTSSGGNSYAYVANSGGGIANLSILQANNNNSTNVATVPTQLTYPTDLAFMTVNGSTLALVIDSYSGNPFTFEVFDTQGGTAYSLSGTTFNTSSNFSSISVDQSLGRNYAFISGQNGFLLAAELPNPTTTDLVNTTILSPGSFQNAIGSITGATGSFIYVANDSSDIVNLVLPKNPFPLSGTAEGLSAGKFVAVTNINGTAVGMKSSSSTPYVNFFTFDSSFTPDVIGSVWVGTTTNGLGFQEVGGTVYGYALTNNNQVAIIDFSYTGPTPPTPSSTFPAFRGNAGVTGNLFNQINNNCLPSTQNVINNLLGLNYQEQYADLSQLTPAFRVIQYSLEKLSFALQNDTSNLLYDNSVDSRLYLTGGYDYLNQQKSGPYTGYRVNSFYQTLGGVKKHNSVKLHAAIGAAESWMKLHPLSAHAYYTTAYGTLGIANLGEKFKVGLSGLFGYSFLNTNRNITFLNEKASSSHNAWNLNLLAHLGYSIENKSRKFTPYEEFGFVYGNENNYKEHGAAGLDFHVKKEKLALIRNTLGFKTEAPINQNIQFFVDIAWVYEHLFDSNAYLARFIGSDAYGTYSQRRPTPNMGQVNAGFNCHNKHFDTEIKYLGLFGNNFVEQTGTIKLIKSF